VAASPTDPLLVATAGQDNTVKLWTIPAEIPPAPAPEAKPEEEKPAEPAKPEEPKPAEPSKPEESKPESPANPPPAAEAK
jgi:hypothetical protein